MRELLLVEDETDIRTILRGFLETMEARVTDCGTVSEAVSAEDTIARLERKLDLAIAQIERLQHRIESIDLTLVRVLSR